MIPDDLRHPQLTELRTSYRLDDLVSGSQNEYHALRKLVAWVQGRWEHDGNRKPTSPDPLTILEEASRGRGFRCVEYSIVLAAATTAMGMPGRVVYLRPAHAKAGSPGTAHVVAEVWLRQFGKWVFADGQFAVIPELESGPLTTLEFKQALAMARSELLLHTRMARSSRLPRYLKWVEPYLP